MLNLAQCSILDIYGVERIQTDGNYDTQSLTQLFVENWIPFMECHKCGKSKYCMYALPHPTNEHKKQEIQCGVARTVIENFVTRTIEIAEKSDNQGKQAYLDGAFYLTKFVLESEQSIGTVINASFLNWYGDFAPAIFGNLTRIRDTLNNLNQNLRLIPAFKSERSILFVEGWSEKEFFNKLKESHSSWFLDLLVECYDGQGNRRSKRIAMLLEKYVELGYTIYVQGDADGKGGDIFKGLVDSGHVQINNTFVFSHDFESSIPLSILIRAMRNIGLPIRFKPSDLKKSLFSKPESIGNALLSFGVDISPHKIALANAVAEILNHSYFGWWQDEDFMRTELGRFMRFVQDIG